MGEVDDFCVAWKTEIDDSLNQNKDGGHAEIEIAVFGKKYITDFG